MSDQQTPPQPEPPGLDLEALARELPFPPTWDERDDALRVLGLPPDQVASPGRPSPLDVRVGPDPTPRRPPRRPRP